jgi:hypothetical protein
MATTGAAECIHMYSWCNLMSITDPTMRPSRPNPNFGLDSSALTGPQTVEAHSTL